MVRAVAVIAALATVGAVMPPTVAQANTPAAPVTAAQGTLFPHPAMLPRPVTRRSGSSIRTCRGAARAD